MEDAWWTSTGNHRVSLCGSPDAEPRTGSRWPGVAGEGAVSPRTPGWEEESPLRSGAKETVPVCLEAGTP